MKLSVLISVLVSLSFIQPLSAQDFEAGMRAYRIKNYTTAIREWTPLAPGRGRPGAEQPGLHVRGRKGR